MSAHAWSVVQSRTVLGGSGHKMSGKDNSDHTKPCWEGVALGWRRDVPDSLRLRSRGGDSLHSRCQGDPGLVLQSEEEPASLSSVRSDSGLNSMEYWDYTVELECIQGHQDSSEAVELDKDLIVKNRELEEVARFQQDTIQDQAMRIEHLCRQTSMLKEMTDSRTKVYEQLEVAVNSLEETNVRLVEEAVADKNRIMTLVENVETVEDRCVELQRCLEWARDAEEVGQMREEVVDMEVEEETKRKESVKQIQRSRERKATEERELLMELAMSRMSDKLLFLEQENRESRCLVKEMDEQVVRLVEENRILREDTSDRNEEEHFSVKEELADKEGFSYSVPACQCQKTGQDNTEDEAVEDVAAKSQEETQDELIAQLDTQYSALIDKYEDLLDLFNQTKEQQSQTQSTRYQMSLHEELSSSDYRVDMMDMLDISHDVSLNISYDVTTVQNDKEVVGEGKDATDEQINDTVRDDKVVADCYKDDEKERHDVKTAKDLEKNNDAMKNKNCAEKEINSTEKQNKNVIIDDDVIPEQDIRHITSVTVATDDLKQSAADINYFDNSEHYPMDHEHVNIHEIKWSTEYSEQIESFCYREVFKQKDEIFRSDIKHKIIDKSPQDQISEFIQNNKTFDNINHDLTLPDDWSVKHIDDGGWNDKYMQVDEQTGKNYSQIFDTLDTSDDVTVDTKQQKKIVKDIKVKITFPEITLKNVDDERNTLLKVFPTGDDFLSEENSSVSSGFSEEMIEVVKVNQECQTDIVFPSKNLIKNVNKIENYQTIFCRMFALLKSENNTF